MGGSGEKEPQLLINLADRFQQKVCTLRKKVSISAKPVYNFPMFQNHMLSQQGMSGSAKAIVVMAAIYLPVLALYTWNAGRHTFYKE